MNHTIVVHTGEQSWHHDKEACSQGKQIHRKFSNISLSNVERSGAGDRSIELIKDHENITITEKAPTMATMTLSRLKAATSTFTFQTL